MYSIKTDLGVTGNGTINKDLLVNGNAVFKGNLQVDGTVNLANATFTQITVTGLANLGDVTASGTASLKDVNVSGDSVLGDDVTDSLTVNATSTFAAPVVLQNNVTQSTGTASFKATSVDSLTVAGQSTLNGNLVMGDDTTATMKNTVTDTLTVNGNSTIGGTIGVTGKATFQDVEINGILSGTYTVSNGNFTNIKVSTLSDLNNVNIKGSTTIVGNLTGTNSTVSVNHFRVLGSTGILDFAYSDPSRPTDIVSSIEPYEISTTQVNAKNIDTDAAEIGVVGGSTGLHALGKATIDYLNITGNSTIGAQNQLQVAGTSVFTGKTTVGDLEITGSVSGLSFTDIDATSLTVSGISNLKGGVNFAGNIVGNTSSSISTPTINVADGTAGNHGIIQFGYNDPDRSGDIKSSVSPYKVAASELESNTITSEDAIIGNVSGTKGLTSKGKATFDYLSIAGNSTIGTASPQLQVAGKSILHDVDFTGTVTGLTVDVSGQDLTPNSVIATAMVQGYGLKATGSASIAENLEVGGVASFMDTASVAGDFTVAGQTTTVQDLVVTGTTTGVTVEANVDGLDIKPESVAATGDVKGATLTSTSNVSATGNFLGAGAQLTGPGTSLAVSNNATIGGILTVVGNSKLKTFESTGNGTVGGTLNVTGKTTVQDLDVLGTLSGSFTVDLTGKDITPNSVVTADKVTVGGAFEAKGASKVTTLTASQSVYANSLSSTTSVTAASANIVGVMKATSVESGTIQAQPSGAGIVTLASNAVAAKDFTVTGVFKPEGGLDLSTVDVDAKSVTTTEGATIGGNLVVSGTVDLSAADVTAKSFISSDSAKSNTFPKLSSTDATIINGNITTLNVASDATFEGNASLVNATLTGTLSVDGVTSVGTLNADSYSTTGTKISLAKSTEITGDLNVTGTLTAGVIDLSTTDVSVKSLNSLGNAHVAGDLTVDGQFDLSATNLQALSLTSTGDTTVGADLVLTTGVVTGSPKISGTLNVTGATSLSTLSTSGLATLNSATVTTDLAVTGSSTLAATTTGALQSTTISSSDKATLNSLEVTTIANITGDLRVQGTLLPEGGLDLSESEINAKSLTTSDGVTVGSDLSATGSLSVSGNANLATVSSTGAAKLASLTVDNSATITAGGLTVSSGGLTVAGNITQSGVDSTSALQKASATELHVGTLIWDPETYIGEFGGSVNIGGDLNVTGTINANINLTGRDIAPRKITTSSDVIVGGTLGVTGQATMSSAIIGEESSENNNLQINGNTVCTGDFTVQGKIIGTLDQSTSDLTVKSLTASTFLKSATLEVTGTSALKDKVTISAGGLSVTGGTATDTLAATGLSTLAGLTSSAKATITAGGLSVIGGTTTDTLTVSGLSTLAAVTASGNLSVTGTTNLTGLATVVNLTSTGTITAKDLTVTGTITADVASLVTKTVTTKKYEVIPAASATAAGGTTWTPDGTSNVYNLTLTGSGNLTIGPMPIVEGKAASWFIYITQSATPLTVTWDSAMGLIGDSAVGTQANGVSICQLVYCGVGTKIDVFIAQRNL